MKTVQARHCPPIEDGDHHTQAEFLVLLTDACRYDKLTRPEVIGPPVNVSVQIDIRHIEAAEHLVSYKNKL